MKHPEMKKLFNIITALFTAIAFISCGNNGDAKPVVKEDTGPKEEQAAANTTSLTPAQMNSIGIETDTIEQKQLTASLKANGVLKVPNQNKASVNSVYNGVIKSLLVQPGNTVSKGQTLATIENPSFIQVQDEYLGINSKIVLAEQEYSRQKELNEGNAGALKNLQAAETELRTLHSRKASLQQQIRLMGINPGSLSNGKLVSVLSVKSPLNGIVSNVKVQIGSYVDVSTSIAEIVDNSQLHLDLFVYEKDLPRLKNNQTIHFTLTNNPGKEYDAQIFSLGSSFEGESKAVSVHAKVPGNKTGLIDGMNITAVISLEKAVVPAVPSGAIVSYQGKDYIFTVTGKAGDGGTGFERVPVVKGTTDVGYTEITLLKEIPAGTKIVTKGAFFILAKMTNVSDE